MLGLARCRRAVNRLEPVFISSFKEISSRSMMTAELVSVGPPALQQKRGMARGRNYYITGGSNKQDISKETKELVRNARNPEDRSQVLGPGIGKPLEMDPSTVERRRALQYTVKYKGSTINDGDDVVRYYPHQGEEIPEVTPSPVLMIQRVKDLTGEPFYNKDYCHQLGVGKLEPLTKLSFVPNIPSVSQLLFKIKHLVNITPVTFPNGISDDFDPEKHGYKLTHRGEFIVHPSLRVDLNQVVAHADWMKLTREQVNREGWRHFKKGFKTILGHDHYHEDTRFVKPAEKDSQYLKNQRMKWTEKRK